MNWPLPALPVRLSTSEQLAVAVVVVAVEDDAEEAADGHRGRPKPMRIEGRPRRKKAAGSLGTSSAARLGGSGSDPAR